MIFILEPQVQRMTYLYHICTLLALFMHTLCTHNGHNATRAYTKNYFRSLLRMLRNQTFNINNKLRKILLFLAEKPGLVLSIVNGLQAYHIPGEEERETEIKRINRDNCDKVIEEATDIAYPSIWLRDPDPALTKASIQVSDHFYIRVSRYE